MLALNRGVWSTLCPSHSTPARDPSTHWLGDWVDTKASLNALGKRKISCHYWDSNPSLPSPQPSHYSNYAMPAPILRRHIILLLSSLPALWQVYLELVQSKCKRVSCAYLHINLANLNMHRKSVFIINFSICDLLHSRLHPLPDTYKVTLQKLDLVLPSGERMGRNWANHWQQPPSLSFSLTHTQTQLGRHIPTLLPEDRNRSISQKFILLEFQIMDKV